MEIGAVELQHTRITLEMRAVELQHTRITLEMRAVELQHTALGRVETLAQPALAPPPPATRSLPARLSTRAAGSSHSSLGRFNERQCPLPEVCVCGVIYVSFIPLRPRLARLLGYFGFS